MSILRAAAPLVVVTSAVLLLTGCATSSPTDSVSSPAGEPVTVSPTPIPTVDPAGTVAFGDDCSNALGDDEVSAAFGRDMVLLTPAWPAPGVRVLGGLSCVWSTPDEFLGAAMALTVYPEAVVAAESRGADPACEEQPGWVDGSEPCRVSGPAGDAWYRLWASPGMPDVTAVETMRNAIVERIAQHPAPAAATREAGWWAGPQCAALTDALAAEDFGYDSAELQVPDNAATDPWTPVPEATDSQKTCSWTLSRGAGDATEWSAVSVQFVPGGGAYFDAIAASEGAQPVDVDGAVGAVTARDDDVYEGHYPPLVANDGTNVLLVRGDGMLSPENFSGFAAALLAALNG